MTRKRAISLLPVVLLVLAATQSVVVAADALDVPRLMPAGAVAVVRMKDGAAFLDAFEHSAFVQRLTKTTFWKLAQASEKEKAKRAKDEQVKKVFGVSGLELMRKIAGKDWGLAIYLPAKGEPEFLMAARALDPSMLTVVLMRITAEAAKKGGGKFVQFSHAGVAITGREGKHGGYVLLKGDAFVFARGKALILKAAELAAGTSKKSVAADAHYQAALKHVAGADGTLYVRAALIARHVAAGKMTPPAKPKRKPGKKHPKKPHAGNNQEVLRFIGSFDTIVGGLQRRPDGVAVEMVVKLAEKVHPLIEACTAVPGPLRSLHLAGENTVLLAAGKMDVALAYEAMRQAVAKHPKALHQIQAMELFAGAALGGKDFRTQILPMVGPEAAVLIARPDPKRCKYPVKLPLGAILLEVKPDLKLRTSIGNLIRMGAAAVTVGANQKSPGAPMVQVKTETYKKVDIFSLHATENVTARMPKKIRSAGIELQFAPSFAYVGRFLVLASHPSVIRGMIDAPKRRQVARNLQQLLGPEATSAHAVFVVDVDNLTGWMKDNLPAIKKLADKPADYDNLVAIREALRLVKGFAAMRSREGKLVRGMVVLKVVK